MTGSRNRSGPRKGKNKRSYHHGDLSEAMVRAALKLIAEFGPSGFTFAEVTRLVGVSPAAPYRHFRDRDALMAFVALRGFERFTKVLRDAWKEGKPDSMTALKNVGHAYLAFAHDEQAYYAAMFETRLPPALTDDIKIASNEAFSVLREATEALIEDLQAVKKPPALMVALHIWSMAHGIAVLFGQGKASRQAIPMEPQDLLEAGILVYLEGLGMKK